MAADPRNEKQLLAMARMWDKMDALARLSEVFPHASGAVPQPVPQVTSAVRRGRLAQRHLRGGDGRRTPKSTQRRRFILEDPRPVATIYETAIGGTSTIELGDGSVITLNTNSRASVDIQRATADRSA